MHVFVLGHGKVAKTLIEELLKSEIHVLVGVADSTNCHIMNGCQEDDCFDEHKRPFTYDLLIALMKGFNDSVIADCTCSAMIPYSLFFANKFHIVTANKLVLALPIAHFVNNQRIMTMYNRFLGYEAAVCSGLPIVDTLKQLKQSGDTIIKVEAILSGTLSRIFNEISSSKGPSEIKLSQIVQKAVDKGSSEPQIWKDLDGSDSAVKALLIMRTLGHDIAYEEIERESLVPEHLLHSMQGIEGSDEGFAALVKEAWKTRQVLRYTAIISKQSCSVRIRKYSLDHCFAYLNGSDVSFIITTENLQSPIVIQGPGSELQSTAFGIISDLNRFDAIINYS